MTIHYPRPEPRPLCDSDRNILAGLQHENQYYCEEYCLTWHEFDDPDHTDCEEHHYLLAEREAEAEAYHEERGY
jgi:hypothetical protein